MRGSLTFKVDPTTQAILVKADMYEMTDFDLLRLATALQEQSFKLQCSLIAKTMKQLEDKKIITEATDFKQKVDLNGK